MFIEEKLDHLLTLVTQLSEQQKRFEERYAIKDTPPPSSSSSSLPNANQGENSQNSQNPDKKEKKKHKLLLRLFGSRLKFRKVNIPRSENLSAENNTASNSENEHPQPNDTEEPSGPSSSQKSSVRKHGRSKDDRKNKENHEGSSSKQKQKSHHNVSPFSERNQVDSSSYSNPPARIEQPSFDELQNSSDEDTALVLDYRTGTSYRQRTSKIRNPESRNRDDHQEQSPHVRPVPGPLTLSPFDFDIIVPDTDTIIRDLKANQCKDCGKTFRTKSKLQIHNQALHLDMNMSKYKCSLCKRGYPTQMQLLRHHHYHNTVPQTTKKHACGHCDKRYVRKSDLISHERVHNGNRPFVCTTCHRAFIRMGALTHHVKMTHIALACPDCHKGFKRRDALKRHRTYHCKKAAMAQNSDVDRDVSYARTQQNMHRAAAGFILN